MYNIHTYTQLQIAHIAMCAHIKYVQICACVYINMLIHIYIYDKIMYMVESDCMTFLPSFLRIH